jgi:hypothetical protein
MLERIKEKLEKIKTYEHDLILILTIVLVGLIAFGLGRLSVIYENKTSVEIKDLSGTIVDVSLGTSDKTQLSADLSLEKSNNKLYVASKNSDKYHYPWCSGAQRIKEENKVWFSSKKEAEAAGYRPASNCKGL